MLLFPPSYKSYENLPVWGARHFQPDYQGYGSIDNTSFDIDNKLE